MVQLKDCTFFMSHGFEYLFGFSGVALLYEMFLLFLDIQDFSFLFAYQIVA